MDSDHNSNLLKIYMGVNKGSPNEELEIFFENAYEKYVFKTLVYNYIVT